MARLQLINMFPDINKVVASHINKLKAIHVIYKLSESDKFPRNRSGPGGNNRELTG